mgnify:CR=1 FL=1
MSWRDRIIGIVLGLIIGIAALIFFVFGFSGESVDAPSLEGTNGGAAATTTTTTTTNPVGE